MLKKDNADIFTYYKPMVPTMRSQETLDYDLGNNLKITKNKASELYELHYRRNKSIIYEEDYLASFIRDFTVKAEEYDNYLISNQKKSNNIYKFIYSIECPEFIYVWIEAYKDYMDQTTLRNLQKIINAKYDNNKNVDEFIRRNSLKDELLNFSNEKFMKFYDYCRLQYLLQNVMQFNYIPKFYNPSSGILYFTTNTKINWEHIFERIGKNKKFVVKFNPTIVNTNYGIVSNGKNLRTSKWSQNLYIDEKIPNYVRYMVEYILLKNKNVKSLKEVKETSFKKCIMTEDFCRKTHFGYTMSLPTKNSWQELGGVELRKTSKNLINLNTIYDSYESTLLNPVLQGCWG